MFKGLDGVLTLSKGVLGRGIGLDIVRDGAGSPGIKTFPTFSVEKGNKEVKFFSENNPYKNYLTVPLMPWMLQNSLFSTAHKLGMEKVLAYPNHSRIKHQIPTAFQNQQSVNSLE